MSDHLDECRHPVRAPESVVRVKPCGVTDSQLAVLLRQAQWALDDTAHDLPAGRTTPREREDLAAILEALVAIIRASTPEGCAG